MHAVMRDYSGSGAKKFFDLLESKKAEVKDVIMPIKGFPRYLSEPRRINHANPRENRCDVRRCRHYRSQQRGSGRSLVWLSSPTLLRLSSLLSSPSLLAPLVLMRSSQGTKAGNKRF
jgi:hypothetical protein